jgi:hypothetical protein
MSLVILARIGMAVYQRSQMAAAHPTSALALSPSWSTLFSYKKRSYEKEHRGNSLQMEMVPMASPQKIENSIQERIDDYLSSFKSQAATPTDGYTVSETGIDDYLLERAAAELRDAQLRLDKHARELHKD